MAHLDSQVAKRLSPSRSITGITTELGVEVGPVLAALACSRMSAVSLTDVCRLRRRGRALVPAVRRPTGRTTLPAYPGASTMTALQDPPRRRRRGLGRIATRTRVRLGAITRHHMSVQSCTKRRQGHIRGGWRCQLFSQVGSGGDYGCGRHTSTGKINEDGRSSRRFSQKESQPGGLSPCLGPSWLAVKGAWRAPRASVRSRRRTCCWARPGSRRWGTMKRTVTSGSRSVAA